MATGTLSWRAYATNLGSEWGSARQRSVCGPQDLLVTKPSHDSIFGGERGARGRRRAKDLVTACQAVAPPAVTSARPNTIKVALEVTPLS